jgi:hypothetical protein
LAPKKIDLKISGQFWACFFEYLAHGFAKKWEVVEEDKVLK